MTTVQSDNTFTAAHDLAATIQHAIRQGDHDAPAIGTAWDNIMALWLSGDTKDVIPALVQSQVNERLFLAEFLCRVWAKYLGDSPTVMGSYIAEHEDWMMRMGGKGLDPQQLNTTRLLIQCGCLHPPVEGSNKDMLTARAWSHIHRAPKNPQWSDRLPDLDTSGDASERVQSIVHEAQDKRMDLDWVVSRCLYALPEGLVGYGQSVEARAFLFCYISSAYDFGRDVLAFQSPSARSHEFLPTLHTLHSHPEVLEPTRIPKSWLLYIFLEQMCPILENFPSPDPTPIPQPSARDSDSTQVPNRPSANHVEGLHPFWLFVVDLSLQPAGKQTKVVWEMLESLLSPACLHYEHLTLPSPPNPTSASKIPIPLMVAVTSTIAGNCFYEGTPDDADFPGSFHRSTPDTGAPDEAVAQDFPRSVRGTPMQVTEFMDDLGIPTSPQGEDEKWHPVFVRTNLKQFLSVRIVEVDVALRAQPDSFLTKAWANALTGLWAALTNSIIWAEPDLYSGCVRAAAGAIVDAYRVDDILEKLDQDRLGVFWLQLVALCGEYVEGFQEAMVEHIDRKTAEKIFVILDLLDPFADEKTKQKVAPLQKIYAQRAYAETQNLPPYLVDRFVEICIELCKKKTVIAQALADGGFVALLTAIQDGVYDYPEEQDLQPQSVREIVRQQMCKDAFTVLADRL